MQDSEKMQYSLATAAAKSALERAEEAHPSYIVKEECKIEPHNSPPVSRHNAGLLPAIAACCDRLATAAKTRTLPFSQTAPSVCYRHQPHVRQREHLLNLEKLLNPLDPSTRTSVMQIWSSFENASSKVREIILLGLLDACCMRQLTVVSRAIALVTKMDILSQLPPSLSLRVLKYLDARSLCRASQVSKSWEKLANDDDVWHHICLQHIDRRCAKCGWGLPLLFRKRKRRSPPEPAVNSTQKKERLPLSKHTPSHTACALDPEKPSNTSLSTRNSTVLTSPTPGAGKDLKSHVLLHTKRPKAQNEPSDLDVENTTCCCLLEPEAKRLRSAAVSSLDNPPQAKPAPTGKQSTNSKPSEDQRALMMSRTSRRNWKAIYAERFGVERNWRQNSHTMYSLIPPTASSQPRINACYLDEPYLMTASMDGLVRLWSLEQRTCCQTFVGHRGAVTCVYLDETKYLALSGGMDGTVRIWNCATGVCVRSLTGGHSVPITSLHFENGVLASADAASQIRIWDFEAKSCFSLCHGNLCAVSRVVLCKGYLYSAGEDGVVRMWDMKTRNCIRTFVPRQSPPDTSPLNVPSSNSLASVTSLHVASIYATEGHAVYLLTASTNGMVHLYSTSAACCSPSSALPNASNHGPHSASTCRAASSCTGTLNVSYPIKSVSHGAPVTSVWFDSQRMLSCGTDGMVHLWDLETLECLQTYSVGGTAGVVTGSDTCIACAREDGVIHIWDFDARS